MVVKVLLWNGLIETVLVDAEAAKVKVEIIDYDENYANRDKIQEYTEELKANKELSESQNYSVANFDGEEEEDKEG